MRRSTRTKERHLPKIEERDGEMKSTGTMKIQQNDCHLSRDWSAAKKRMPQAMQRFPKD